VARASKTVGIAIFNFQLNSVGEIFLCTLYKKTNADGEPDTGYANALNKDAVSGSVFC
jgi:hypothetical protein